MLHSKNIQKLALSRCVDTLEFCPFKEFFEYLAVGTYELDDSTCKQNRLGGLHIYCNQDYKLRHLLSVDQPGVLDLKWYMQSDVNCFIVSALSNGNIGLYKFHPENVIKVYTHKVDSCLLLSIAQNLWTPNILVSTSNGQLANCPIDYLNPNDQSPAMQKWKGHEYEAWTVTYNSVNPNIVLSGGDDNLLHIWDLRALYSSSGCKPIHTSNYHSMGVCSLNGTLGDKNLYASGSFDQNFCIWDYRQQSKPLLNLKLDGGIWRIKWIPKSSDKWYILLAATHAGLYLLEYSTSVNEIKEIIHYEHSNSLTYGADWQRVSDTNLPLNLASSSFYEKEIHLLPTFCNVTL